MKIAISTEGKDLSSVVDQRFGRAKGFLIYDVNTNESVYVDNKQNLEAPQGAGIQSAKTVIDAGADALITGNVGPKAFTALNAAGVKIFLFKDGTAGTAIDKYGKGELELTSTANVEGHW
ncbi:MAG TPA: NifB/NifX family molybdenum-iron cluster-binding protein [Spirochaetota bacterium]|nr:NifB/NifX family molybdenum-iron cluster-binding protein [Spirochaetota bacterium]HPS86167.1 NifB/NifX family molybdenum-iron cluster-binding protein [Spirochaetota bacterium]